MPQLSTTKAERLRHANELISAISRHGRRFFYNHENNRTAHFRIKLDGRLYFRDDYTDTLIYTAYRGRWRYFSHGGNMRRLVDDLATYIRTGERIWRGHFGPWPGWRAGGDLWFYGPADMAALRQEIDGNPALRRPAEGGIQ